MAVSFRINVFANGVGVAVMALAPILAIPWYLRLLGPEQWGLVAFLTSMLAVLAGIDAGFGQAIVREFYQRVEAKADTSNHQALLLYGLERIYLIFAVLTALLIAVTAHWLAVHWLKLDGLEPGLGLFALVGGGVLFAVQFPGSVYRSVLIGTQAQVTLNLVLVFATLLRHLGGILILLAWPTLQIFIVWLVLVSLLETLVRRRLVWRILEKQQKKLFWDYRALRKLLVPAVGLSGAVLLGVLAIHVDKLVLSRILPIEQFGYYAIAATVAFGALQAIYPLANAALPKIVQLRDAPEALFKFNLKLVILIIGIVAVSTLVFSIFGRQLLAMWLDDSRVETIVYSPLVILLLGSAMNAIYSVGYMNWLADGRNLTILWVNGSGLVLALLLVPFLVSRYGLEGAASGWFAINLMGVLIVLGGLGKRALAPYK